MAAATARCTPELYQARLKQPPKTERQRDPEWRDHEKSDLDAATGDMVATVGRISIITR